MGRGAFLIFAKQAHLVSDILDTPAIDVIFKASVGFSESSDGKALGGFSHFNTAVQTIAAHQQNADECTPEILQSFAETHLRPLLSKKHRGEVPEPCMLMWEDAYVDACSSSFRDRLRQPFKYYFHAARGTEQCLVDRYVGSHCVQLRNRVHGWKTRHQEGQEI